MNNLEEISQTLSGYTLKFPKGGGRLTIDMTRMKWENHMFLITGIRVINHFQSSISVIHAKDPIILLGDYFGLIIGSKSYIHQLPLVLCTNEWYKIEKPLLIPPRQNFAVEIVLHDDSKGGTFTPFLNGKLSRPVQ